MTRSTRKSISAKTIILLPPSEGKQDGGLYPALEEVAMETKELLKKIKTEKNPGKLYGVKGAALEAALDANGSVLQSKTLPAIERYSGVVFQGLDFDSLSDAKKKIAAKRIYFVSALFGLVRADQLIPNYKMKIDKLGAAKLWLTKNSEQLKNCFVIDLLPQAHKKAVSYEKGIAIEFVIEKNGKKIPAGHNGKLVKGKFARWLIEDDVSEKNIVKKLKEFKEDGFKWNGEFYLKITT